VNQSLGPVAVSREFLVSCMSFSMVVRWHGYPSLVEAFKERLLRAGLASSWWTELRD